ncbi:MAG: DsrE/DsrF/DrsH-like family protein [Acidobacteriota bacterium]
MEVCAEPLVLLILSGDREKALAAANLALAARVSGRPVFLFFTFWGLNLVKRKGARSRGPLLARLLAFLNRDHAGRQRLGRFHLGGLGGRALGRIAARKGVPSFAESLRAAHRLGARVVACSTTLELMGLSPENLVSEVDEVAGAAAFLEAARGGQIVSL